jgi:hypothetical protein
LHKIPNDPWENMSLITDAIMAGEAFSYLEKIFIKEYECFCIEKEQILKNYNEERNLDRYLEISIYNDLFIILGCAMIELWVNSFGIHLLNEDYYHKNIERMGIIEKIKILIAIHKKEEIDDNNEIIKDIRKLFDSRNRLVHPKAKRFKESLIEDLAFDPKKIDNKDYLFVKKTLKKTHKFFKDNDIIPYFIEHINKNI